jgi:hypothetical protein
VTIRNSWLGLETEMVIQTKRMEPVAGLPGMCRRRVVLGVAKRDRPVVEKLVADLHRPSTLSAKPARFEAELD